MSKTYQEYLKYYKNATKKQVIEDIMLEDKHMDKLTNDYLEMKDNFRTASYEIKRLNKEKENLTKIVANKIIKDYDIETPLKDELNKERIKNGNLSDENNRLNKIIKEAREEIRILVTNSDIADYQAQKLFQILDKVEENTNGKD